VASTRCLSLTTVRCEKPRGTTYHPAVRLDELVVVLATRVKRDLEGIRTTLTVQRCSLAR